MITRLSARPAEASDLLRQLDVREWVLEVRDHVGRASNDLHAYYHKYLTTRSEAQMFWKILCPLVQQMIQTERS